MIKKHLLTIFSLVIISTASFAQAKKETLQSVDSATVDTKLISYRDVAELDAFLSEKLLAKDYKIVIAWLTDRINQRVREHNSKLKK